MRRIVRGAKQVDYRFSSLVLGIVNSRPFQMRMAEAEHPEDAEHPQDAED